MLTFLGNVRKMLPFNCDLKPNYYICLWLNPNSWLKTINTTGIYNRPRKVANTFFFLPVEKSQLYCMLVDASYLQIFCLDVK